jgi:hypothetical protein
LYNQQAGKVGRVGKEAFFSRQLLSNYPLEFFGWLEYSNFVQFISDLIDPLWL